MNPSEFNLFLASALTLALTALSALCGDAMAGSFKTLDTAGLAIDAQIQVRSSPKSTPEGAIEMEVYEWQTAPEGGVYQCRILVNNTGQPLSIRLVGLDGNISASCSAIAGSACDTAANSFVGDAKFQCLVATSATTDAVVQGANYKMAIQRTSAPVGPTLGRVLSPSGVIGE